MSVWTEQAARLKDYRPGNAWESLLRRAMSPAKAAELGPDLEPFLRVQTSRALDQYELMLDQGTAPQVAQELARADLLAAAG